MSNLFTYLMQFDDADTTAEDERTAGLLSPDPDVTLDLRLEERRDFNATLNAIKAARIASECDRMWREHEAAGDD